MSAILNTDWGDVFTTYHSKVRSFVYRRTNDWALAEDMASDIFYKAIDYSARNEQGPDSFSAWLYRIARNLIIDYYRARDKHPCVSWEDMAILPSDDDLEAMTERISNVEMLQSVLSRLTQEQAQVLVMRYQEGLSFAEIAAEMGKNEGAVKALIHRACEAANTILRPGAARGGARPPGHHREVEMALREYGPMTVKELARMANHSIPIINSALYSYPQTFVKVGMTQGMKAQIYVWGLVGVHDKAAA